MLWLLSLVAGAADLDLDLEVDDLVLTAETERSVQRVVECVLATYEHQLGLDSTTVLFRGEGVFEQVGGGPQVVHGLGWTVERERVDAGEIERRELIGEVGERRRLG
jgi:hypothetical protein